MAQMMNLDGLETTTPRIEVLSLHTTTMMSTAEIPATAVPCTTLPKTGDTPSLLATSTTPTLTASKHQMSPVVNKSKPLSVTPEDLSCLATTKSWTTVPPSPKLVIPVTLVLLVSTPLHLGIKRMFHSGISLIETSMMPV